MTVDKVIAKIIWLTFFGPPCMACIVTEAANCMKELFRTELLPDSVSDVRVDLLTAFDTVLC